ARRSYDFVCKRGARELHVEVKATTTDGDTIVLTNNEVKHACDGRNSCVLFVLHSIRLKGKKATGGKPFVLNPWEFAANAIDADELYIPRAMISGSQRASKERG